MIGKRRSQGALFDVGNVFPVTLKPGSFHAQLAAASGRLFSDADFAAFYSERTGRPSVPPSLLALTVLLQNEACVSDEEAIERTAFDLRWAAVLGRQAGEPLCVRSTLELFRAHLLLHNEVRRIFLCSIREAKRAGLLKGKALRIAVDTKPIEGRGAVQDTYNLLASGIVQLSSAIAKALRQKPDDWMRAKGLQRYVQPSIKGSADIDWADEAARNALLAQIVSDARGLLQIAGRSHTDTKEAARLLEALLLQDVEETISSTGGPQAQIKQGTAKGRIPSATDPQQRHGRKSKSKTFTGAKASVAVDIESQIIVATDVLSGDAPDNYGTLQLVVQAEANAGQPVAETIGDCAYGDGETRQAFADAQRELLAKVPKEADRGGLFPKSAFQIDLERNTVTCPAGQTTTTYVNTKEGGKVFQFRAACNGCALRPQCMKPVSEQKTPYAGRTIRIHPQEALLQAARAYQQTPQGRAHLRERVVVEHRLARLGQLGIGKARYIGLNKTGFQLMLAATVANLRRTWNWAATASTSPRTGPSDAPKRTQPCQNRWIYTMIHIFRRALSAA